jgi:hypothetical protein
MTENRTDLDWFHHFHQVAITELVVLMIADVKLQQDIDVSENQSQRALLDHHQRLLQGIVESLKQEEKLEPASVFQRGLTALSDIEKERFLLENLLEAVKRGESFRNMLERYNTLKLTDYEIANLPRESPAPTKPNIQSPVLPSSSIGAGSLLRQLLGRLKKVSLKIMQLLVNALRVIPKFMSIKPSIGFSGPFPSLSFQLDLQTESRNLYELFQELNSCIGMHS